MNKADATVVQNDRIINNNFEYDPKSDWINQKDLAAMLDMTPETASRKAKNGKLKIFEHRMMGAGKRKYSKTLVQQYQELQLNRARKRLIEATEEGGHELN